jgi:hypothetical protein
VPAGAPAAAIPGSSYQVLTTADAQAWRDAWPTDGCVMAGLEYMRVQEQHLGWEARLFITESNGCRIAYPFFLRPVPPHPRFLGERRWDTASPEYAGPVLLDPGGGDQSLPVPGEFQERFGQFCRSTGIVAEFAHLNPWIAREDLLDAAGIELNREIVYVDLTRSEEEIWKHSLSSDTRRQTRQAMDAGVQVRRAESTQDVLAFHRLHRQTMERLAAKERYFLPPSFFLGIFETMPRNAFFMLSEFQGRIVAGGLYFQDAANVYWHLSAVDLDFSRVRPVNAFHYETIRQAARAGKQRMLCGGAFQRGDGVFRFKAGFSPLRISFKVYKRVHDRELYGALTEDWIRRHPGLSPEPGFFPAYRSAVPEDEGPVEEKAQ